MTKKEWIIYFETVNGRKPTPNELSQAIQQGIITESDINGVNSSISSQDMLARKKKIHPFF